MAIERPHSLLRSASARQSMMLGAAMIAAGGLDYGVNVIAGRRLGPLEFGVFIAVMALLQVLALMSIAIRMVVAFYTAELSAQAGAGGVAALLRDVGRWAWRYGVIATVVLGLAAPPLARVLHLPGPWPLWAASGMGLMLFLREAAFGGLQGVQAFVGLSVAQVIQAVLRLGLCVALIEVGWRASGAVLAQPLAAIGCIVVSAMWLRPHLAARGGATAGPISWKYSLATLVGLVVFGLLTNLDALFVRRYFAPRAAANYAPVVTLAKVCLFLPWAVGLVIFPKVARRKAAGEDTRAILIAALVAALSPGIGLSAIYLLFPGPLVSLTFTRAYANPGVVLGLAGLAATLQAGLHIWLNYALSTERKVYVYLLAGVLAWQAAGMWLYGRGNLVSMTLVMVSAGLLGNVAGCLSTWTPAPQGAVSASAGADARSEEAPRCASS